MDRWKAEMGRVREEKRRDETRREEKRKRKKLKKRKSQKKEDPGARKGRKVAKHYVFPMICGSGGSKSRLALKRRVRSQLAKWEVKKCTPLWREARLQLKKLKATHVRTTFGSWDVEKVHAVVARSTFPSQNAQSTSCSDHFWKLSTFISKRKCIKHTRSEPLW